jgi:hypothetical protein
MLFVPKIDTETDGRMDLLQIYNEEDLDSLPSGVWGIKEPDRLRDGRLRASGMTLKAVDSNKTYTKFHSTASDLGLDMILLPGE